MNRRVPIVLLIEHDPIQRGTMARLLKAGGYSVIPVRRAQDAFETLATHHLDITLVLASTQSETSAGPALFSALFKIAPQVPVLALSPVSASGRLALDYPNVAATLTIPFEPADLLAHVQDALLFPCSAPQQAFASALHTSADQQATCAVGRQPTSDTRVNGIETVSFSWPPTEADLEAIQVVDALNAEPLQWLRPSSLAMRATPVAEPQPLFDPAAAPATPVRRMEYRPAELVVRGFEYRRIRPRAGLTRRWMTVAATAFAGLAITTLMEVTGAPGKGDATTDETSTVLRPPVLSAGPLRVGAMRLVPTGTVISRSMGDVISHRPVATIADLPVDAANRLTRALQPDNRSRGAMSREPGMAARDREREDQTIGAWETRAEPVAATMLAPAVISPRSLTPSPELETTHDGAAFADAPAPPLRRSRDDERDIYQVLQQYERAYERLDVNAARAVWPSLNTRALARAFDGLKEQALEFSNCRVAMASQEATAICGGHASYVPRVGRQVARTASREWTFHLRKVEQDWLIAKADVR
jgi:CheY-like chemotaxis protein